MMNQLKNSSVKFYFLLFCLIPLTGEATTQHYKLENIEVKGTTRIDKNKLEEDFALSKGALLDDEIVLETRARLLSLGLFKSVLLYMKKGSARGWAVLVVEVDDDDSVLGGWGLAGNLAVEHNQVEHLETVPMNYHLGIVGRNLFYSFHRATAQLTMDGNGNIHEWLVAYGLPRFNLEGVQFDALIEEKSYKHSFINTQGFSRRKQALWSYSNADYSHFRYGVAMYENPNNESAVPGFPNSIVGPKFVYEVETRLVSFFPEEGYSFKLGLLADPTDASRTAQELAFDLTFHPAPLLWSTLSFQGLAVSEQNWSARVDLRFDFPFLKNKKTVDQAEWFLILRGGEDQLKNKSKLKGSAAVTGLRYHSAGFIAELAFKITKNFVTDRSL